MNMNSSCISILFAMTALATPAHAIDCEDDMRAFTDLNGELCIPEDPQRIVSLHDLTITLALLELGGRDQLVGSHGRMNDAGEISMAEAVELQQGITFDNSNLTFVGTWDAPDFEAIAGLEPDLILARASNADQLDQLELIAPVVITNHEKPFIDFLGELADIAGLSDAYDKQKAAYDARVAEISASIPNAAQISVANMYVEPGSFWVYYDFYALSQAMTDVGLKPAPGIIDYFTDFDDFYDHASGKDLTAERLDIIDADYLLLPYWTLRADGSETYAWTGDMPGPDYVKDAMEATVPGYCTFLASCGADQVIPFEATGVYAMSFDALNQSLDFIEATFIDRTPRDVVN